MHPAFSGSDFAKMLWSEWERLWCMRHFEKHSRRDMPARKKSEGWFPLLWEGCLWCPREAWGKCKTLAGGPSPNPARSLTAGPARANRALHCLPPAVSEAHAPGELKVSTMKEAQRGTERGEDLSALTFPPTDIWGLSWGRDRIRRGSEKVGDASDWMRDCSFGISLYLTS